MFSAIKSLPINPVSRRYGREHGTPIDRYYIEKFLDEHKRCIRGTVAEFADDAYTKRFGQKVMKSIILHVNGWGENVIKADLVTGEGISESMVDCLICTQTIQFIFELESAIKNIYRLLKKDGVALITAHGIAQISLYDYRNWGEYWRFTKMAFQKLIDANCEGAEYEVSSYGNVKSCVSALYGMCIEDMDENDLTYDDEQYPFILGVLLRRTN